MSLTNTYSANFGPMSVLVAYNEANKGVRVTITTGPTTRPREFARMDLFPENAHFHINHYQDPNPLATVRTVEGKTTPTDLRKHLLDDVKIEGLACLANETDVADYLRRHGDAEPKTYINDKVEEISRGVQR